MTMIPLILGFFQLDLFGEITTDASLLSSIAIILGAIFVVIQIRDDKRNLEASIKQANASELQVRLNTDQLKQNYELATMDLVTKIYDQANSMEIQTSWLTVIRTKVKSYDEFMQLPESKQLAYLQIASLFESLGLLVERGYVSASVIDDMFATQLAWESLEPFIMGMRKEHPDEDYYYFFERLRKRLSGQLKDDAGPGPEYRMDGSAPARLDSLVKSN